MSGVTAIPLGKATPSATCRAEPSAVTTAMVPGTKSAPAIRSKPEALT
jgi:hypothetical protein